MTPTELSRLPIGTEVLVRAKLRHNVCTRSDVVALDYPHGYVTLDRIEGVAPPRPLKVGDEVRHTNGSAIRTIRWIFGDQAFCTWGSTGGTASLDNLTPA